MNKLCFFSTKIQLLVVFFFCGTASITYPTQKAKSLPTQTALAERIQDELEGLLKQVLIQLNNIDGVLQELALLVNNNQVAKNGNKKELINSIRSMRSLIDSIRSDAFVTIDLHSIFIMLKLNNALMDHIGKALSKGFSDIPPFDVQTEITKHIDTHADVQVVLTILEENEKKLAQLNTRASNAGLHWYNHAYRSLNEHVLQPAQKYKLGTIATLGAAGAGLLWWYTDSPRLPMLRSMTGWRPKTDSLGGLDREYHKLYPLGPLGTIENWNREARAYLYAPMILPLMYASCKNEMVKAKIWLQAKIHNGINKLKGGINEKEVDSISRKNPDIDFSNIIGNEAAKAEGWKVVKYMEDPERYDRFKMQVERGILLIGDPRTGKTYFAEALAGEIKKVLKKQGRTTTELGFYNIKASLIAKHGIEYVLNLAKREAPCVLFIDEIDLLALQRVGGDRDTLYAFLTSMSGCFERDLDKRVIIIGATNNPQNLDRALKARGRFGMILEFTYPDFHERKLYLEKQLNALTLNLNSIDLDALARETEGCSYEALLATVREAFMQAKITGAVINQELLEHALDCAVRNIVFDTAKEIPTTEQRIIATHMAGHALATMLLPTSKKLAKVTTLPVLTEIEEEAVWDTYSKKDKDTTSKNDKTARVTQFGQLFTYHEKDTLLVSDEPEKIRQCMIELSGHIAEKLLLGSCGYSYHPDDTQKAYATIKSIIFQGHKESELSENEINRRKDAALAMLAKCEQDAVALLEQHRQALEHIASILEQKKTLSAAQICALIDSVETHPEAEQNDTQQTSSQEIASSENTSSAPKTAEKKLSEEEIHSAILHEFDLPEVRTA